MPRVYGFFEQRDGIPSVDAPGCQSESEFRDILLLKEKPERDPNATSNLKELDRTPIAVGSIWVVKKTEGEIAINVS